METKAGEAAAAALDEADPALVLAPATPTPPPPPPPPPSPAVAKPGAVAITPAAKAAQSGNAQARLTPAAKAAQGGNKPKAKGMPAQGPAQPAHGPSELAKLKAAIGCPGSHCREPISCIVDKVTESKLKELAESDDVSLSHLDRLVQSPFFAVGSWNQRPCFKQEGEPDKAFVLFYVSFEKDKGWYIAENGPFDKVPAAKEEQALSYISYVFQCCFLLVSKPFNE